MIVNGPRTETVEIEHFGFVTEANPDITQMTKKTVGGPLEKIVYNIANFLSYEKRPMSNSRRKT